MTNNEYGFAYQKGYQQTLRALRARGLDHFGAEEIAQRAWCKGYERLGQLRDPGAVNRWVQSIARNLLRNDAAHSKVLCELLPAHERATAFPAADVSIDLDRILRFCRPAQRSLLEGRYLDARSTDDVARSLGVSKGAVDQRISRALGTIRKAIGCQPRKGKERRGHAANGNGN